MNTNDTPNEPNEGNEQPKSAGCDGSKTGASQDPSQAKPLKNNDKNASVTGVTGVTGGVPSRGKCTIAPFDYDRKVYDKPIKAGDLASFGQDIFYRLLEDFNQYIRAPKGLPEIAGMWNMHTHLFGVWRVAPRLVIHSPEPECGKTTALSMLLHTSARGYPVSNTSGSSLYRGISGSNPPRTWFMDELDSYTDEMKKALVNILNSGHTPEFAYVDRTAKNDGEGYSDEHMSTFAPICMATIKKLPPTWKSRSIVLNLQRKHPNDKLQDWDTRPAEVDKRLELIRVDSARWAEVAYPMLLNAQPAELPSGIGNREAQNLRPLFAVAEVLGLVDVTATAYTNLKILNIIEPTKIEELLTSICEVLKEGISRTKYVHTQTIVDRLKADKRWRGLDGLGLSTRLNSIGVRPQENAVREFPGGKQLRGDLIEDFMTAMAIYGPAGAGGVTPVTPGEFDNEINGLGCDGSGPKPVTAPVTDAQNDPLVAMVARMQAVVDQLEAEPLPMSDDAVKSTVSLACIIHAMDDEDFEEMCQFEKSDLWSQYSAFKRAAPFADMRDGDMLARAADRIGMWVVSEVERVDALDHGGKPNGKA